MSLRGLELYCSRLYLGSINVCSVNEHSILIDILIRKTKTGTQVSIFKKNVATLKYSCDINHVLHIAEILEIISLKTSIRILHRFNEA